MTYTSTDINYFALFNLPEQFTIDINLLNERYLALQQIIHPDVYANASDAERRLALQKSALLNEALRTLKEPLARANYLLAQHGVQTNFHSATTADTEFLMEQMQLREELAEIQNIKSITKFFTKLQNQYAALMNILADELDKQHWSQAQDIVHKLQFLSKLKRNAEEIEANLHENY